MSYWRANIARELRKTIEVGDLAGVFHKHRPLLAYRLMLAIAFFVPTARPAASSDDKTTTHIVSARDKNVQQVYDVSASGNGNFRLRIRTVESSWKRVFRKEGMHAETRLAKSMHDGKAADFPRKR